jgi:hypothetical protein
MLAKNATRTRPADGSKSQQAPFNWEEHAADGSLITHLWVNEQKLTIGIEVAAELWSLIKESPSASAIVVRGDDHAPCSLTGHELLELQKDGQITLYPSRYRLVQLE